LLASDELLRKFMQVFTAPRQCAVKMHVLIEHANDSTYLSKAQYLAVVGSISVHRQGKNAAE
jgi:hypothetical protein